MDTLTRTRLRQLERTIDRLTEEYDANEQLYAAANNLAKTARANHDEIAWEVYCQAVETFGAASAQCQEALMTYQAEYDRLDGLR